MELPVLLSAMISRSVTKQEAHQFCRFGDRCGASCGHRLDATDPAALANLDCVLTHRRYELLLQIAVIIVLALFGGGLAYRSSANSSLDKLKVATERQLALNLGNLEREIGKFGLLPLSASLNRDVIDFLAAPVAARQSDEINRYLKILNDRFGTLQTYLVDPTGLIVASSNRHDADDFVGRNISYRSYFRNASPGRIEVLYGIGTTGNAPGYYLATAVEADGKRLGVVAIKIGLEQLQSLWHGSERPIILSDDNGVVVLSSVAEWQFGVTVPLDLKDIALLDESQLYNRHPLHALDWTEKPAPFDGAALVDVSEGGKNRPYLAVSSPVPGMSMRLTVMSELTNVNSLAWLWGLAVTAMIAFAGAVLLAMNQRRISIGDRLAARKALQMAHDGLEIQLEQRSAELRAANHGLRKEVAVRIQAAKHLQAMQDEMIRTENLAVIGQLSAGLAHEINQPLAALSTLSANAVRYLERDDLGTVRFNLGRICELVQRMGAITSQLRSFARRSTGDLGAVTVASSVDSAITLLGHRLTKDGIVLELRAPSTPLKVRCEVVRLEQVLVNLISNAIDATSERSIRHIVVTWRQQGERVLVDVADNGIGLPVGVKERLFEPFFTTKMTSGLGLGLAISADIVKGFGGTLTAGDNPDGGAVFSIDLPITNEEPQG